MHTLYFAAARDAATSPSGWASFWDAAGLKPRGKATWIHSVRLGLGGCWCLRGAYFCAEYLC